MFSLRSRLFICTIMMSAVLVLASSGTSTAEELTRIVPLHIKISATTLKSNGIRIHKGQIPKSAKQRSLALPAVNNKGGSIIKRIGSPEELAIEASITCAMNRNQPMSVNRIDNLADSLKQYMRVEKLDANLIDTLKRVSNENKVDFELLLVKAMLESDLGRTMKSPVSTARGVFQYIESTWLAMVKKYGDSIGYKHFADAIEINATTGHTSVKKSSAIKEADILDLRFNPYAAATIKAMQIKDESAILKELKDGEQLSATDHYIAHMLGLTLAEEFYKLKNEESDEILAFSPNPLFREAVAINRPFFYDERSRGLTAAEAYNHFRSRIASAYNLLRKIETQYSKEKTVTDDCNETTIPTAPKMPAMEAAKVEKPTMLPAKGFALASISPASN